MSEIYTFKHAHLPMLVPGPETTGSALLHNLYRACSVRRADGAATEAQFVAWLCNRLPVTMIDGAGNIHVDLRTGPQHRTMFTSHTDTVHYTGGSNGVRIDTTDPKRTLWRADEHSCLGADDGAGIALMMHMITSGVPGLYVFFRGEEVGGTGSNWLASQMPDVLDEIDRCISLDRAGYGDVVTHQAGERCCSDEFADALSAALTTDDLSMCYTPTSMGVFTDSANLTRIVAECTNLSVGYADQHGDGEWQDVTFLEALATALVRVQWDALPAARDPKLGDFCPRELPRVYLDAETDCMVDALWSAADGSTGEMCSLLSAWVMPEDPRLARLYIDPRRLESGTYAGLAQELELGAQTLNEVFVVLEDCLVTN
jgi:hypothetical protein